MSGGRLGMEFFLDIFTVVITFGSVASGAWLLGRPWTRRPLRLKDVRRGDITPIVHVMGCFSTFGSIGHLSLMTWWSFQEGDEKLGALINWAFDWWHVGAASFVISLHIFFDFIARVHEHDRTVDATQ